MSFQGEKVVSETSYSFTQLTFVAVAALTHTVASMLQKRTAGKPILGEECARQPSNNPAYDSLPVASLASRVWLSCHNRRPACS